MTPLDVVTRAQLAESLRRLGLGSGDVVLVHASLSSLGHVPGGPVTVVRALLDVVGPTGTIVVPTFTAGNSDPSRWALTRGRPVPRESWELLRETLPPFDPARTPSERMGVIAETVRTWPGAVRSTHPQTSFAAVGAAAATLMAEHSRECHFGPGTPLARLADLSARVLLLGVSYRACTAFHLGEYAQRNPPQRDYECVILEQGTRRWFRYRDIVLSDHDFDRLGQALEESERGGEVRHGRAGRAELRLIPLRTCADFARSWLRDNRERGWVSAG